MSPSVVRFGWVVAILALACLVAPVAADYNLTKKAYEKIDPGLTVEEVQKILGGKGEERAELNTKGAEFTIWEWKEKGVDRWIRVEFKNGKVIAKAEKALK
jgi:hypothetical protein